MPFFLRSGRLHTGVGGERLKIERAGHPHDQIARAFKRVLRSVDVMGLRPRVVERPEVEDGLRQIHPRIEYVEWSDDGRHVSEGGTKRSKTECLQVILKPRLRNPRVDVRQQRAQLLPSRPACAAKLLVGGQHAEVVLERPVHRVKQCDGHHVGGTRTGRDASQKDARGWRRRQPAGRRLILGGGRRNGDD